MKKTLIALTLAALPVAASAEVILFGDVKGGAEFTKVKGVDNTISNINDWGSSFGIKGEESLGAGVKAIWQLEQNFSLDNKDSDNDKFGTKDTFIGLQTGFGTVKAGHVSDQFNGNMDTLDAWQGNGIRTLGYKFGRTSDRYTGVRYDTPEFAGFSANVLYSPEDNTRYDQARDAGVPALDGFAGYIDEESPVGAGAGVAEAVNTVTVDDRVVAVGLNYENSGVFAKYGYKNIGAGSDYQVHRVELGYDANNLFVGLGYQLEDADGAEKQHEVAATVAYTFGNITPRLSYAQSLGGEEKDELNYRQIIGGVDYALSKRTTALLSVAYAQDRSGDEKRKAYSAGLGLRHLF